MKKILSILILNLSYLCFSQVGIGTTTPRGILDVNNTTTSIFGLVLPTNDSVTKMQNPLGGSIAFGTIMYDSTDDCIKYYHQNTANDGIERWSPCILQSTNENIADLDYIVIGRSFTGNYKEDTSMTAANTFKIAVTNEAFGTANLTFLPSDLVLSGVSGITVTSVSPTTASLAAGATVELTYTLSGTPADCGALTGTWTKLNLEYSRTISIVPNLIYNCSAGSWNNSVMPEYRLNGLIPGQSYYGTYSVPYSGGSTSDCDLPPEIITRDGLRLVFPGGPVSETGTIDYALSGTYTGPSSDGWVSFVTSTGCTIYLGPCATCKEILQELPGTPDGVYKINIDKQATVYNTASAQCDMTTDGGGWTLMANYAVSYAVQPLVVNTTTSIPTSAFNNKLPLIGTSTLGVNETGNTTTFGSGGGLLAYFIEAPTEWRVWGIRSNNNSTTIAQTANWKAPLTAAIRTSMINNTAIANPTLPTTLPGNTVTPTVWGQACCSAWGGRRTNTGVVGNDTYGFWNGYLQIQRESNNNNASSTRDNAIYRVWVR